MVKGKAAVRALRCYLEWAGSLYPYPVSSTEDEFQANKDFQERINEMREKIEEICKNPKTLEVYAL